MESLYVYKGRGTGESAIMVTRLGNNFGRLSDTLIFIGYFEYGGEGGILINALRGEPLVGTRCFATTT